MDNQKILVNFVHGYNNNDIDLPKSLKPALWEIKKETQKIHKYPFPRNPKDFQELESLIVGESPSRHQNNFKKLPRFGLTGMSIKDNFVYSGSWNGVYEIDQSSCQLKRIISHSLMSDLHGIFATKDYLITVLTCKDTVVFTDYSGKVIDHFTVSPNLDVYKDDNLEDIDWRFISKQFRGSCGFWHFNYVQKIENEIWLTSRNANSFVVVDLTKKLATMRLMNLCTPVLLHDGTKIDDKYHFTSIDGKIIIAHEKNLSPDVENNWEKPNNLNLYNRDLNAHVIRINETNYGREPNWCRGLSINNDAIYVTIDGRYDSDLSFGILKVSSKINASEVARLHWKEIDDEYKIRYVTGFDLEVFNS